MRWRDIAITYVLAFVVSVAVMAALVVMKGPREPRMDEITYFKIVHDLNEHGVFTDGPFAKPGDELKPGRFLAPVYPGILHLISMVDSRLAAAVACHAKRRGQTVCPNKFGSIHLLQVLTGGTQAFFVFVIALLLSQSIVVAWLTLTIVLASGEFSYYSWVFLTENTAFFGFYGFLLAIVVGLKSGRTWAYALAGIAIAFTALTRPSFALLIYATAIALLLLSVFAKNLAPRVRFVHVAAFAMMAGLVLAPWMIRNWLQFGDPALTSGYEPLILAFRVSYNAMTLSEWAIAWIYWLPDFGDSLAKALFAPEQYERLGFRHPQSYFLQGHTVASEAASHAQDSAGQVDYLLDNYVFNQLGKHTLVSIPITLRGLWVGKYLAILGLLLLYPTGRLLAKRGMLVPFLAVVGALFFITILHGFVTINIPRYNTPLIALYAFVVAYMVVHWLTEARLQRRESSVRQRASDQPN